MSSASCSLLSGASMNRFRALLSEVFIYGVARGFLAKNPVDGTKAFKEAKPRERFLLADERERLARMRLARNAIRLDDILFARPFGHGFDYAAVSHRS